MHWFVYRHFDHESACVILECESVSNIKAIFIVHVYK